MQPVSRVHLFIKAVHYSDVDTMRRVFQEEPDLLNKIREMRGEWIVHRATRYSTPETIRVLSELGADVNEQDDNGWTGLFAAVVMGRYDAAKALLECGADPNLNHPLLGAIRSNKIEDPVAMARLLLDHGADVNRVRLAGGDPCTILTDLIDSERKELIDFLKSRGAKLPEELPSCRAEKVVTPPREPGDYHDDIEAHFRTYYGEPDKWGIREIIPSLDYPLFIHRVSASANKNEELAVLFTSGLSRYEMQTPEDAQQYRRAELRIVLPKDWPKLKDAIKEPTWAWPITWMLKIAAYPIENGTWLGAELSTLADEFPPRTPLGPGTAFTAWFMTSMPSEDSVIRCSDGATIQLYQLFPIYTEEYLFAREHGAGALLPLFMKYDTQEEVDVNRVNVITGRRG